MPKISIFFAFGAVETRESTASKDWYYSGNNKSGSYMELIEALVKSFGEMGYRMSMKIHTLDAYPDSFKENRRGYSEEQGKR